MGAAEGFEEFVSIVERESVTAAAEELGLPRPTVSRRLARLEERLGVRLLHRTTRRMKLTHEGELLYATARRVVVAAREVEEQVQRLDGVPRGVLRLTVPGSMPQGVFGGWLLEFMAAYPEVRVESVATSVHVDLVAEGFDLALRAGEIEDPSLIVRTLGYNRTVAVASGAYLARAGRPTEPGELTGHDCVVGFRAGSAPELRWPLYDGGWVPVSGTLATNEMGLRVEVAKRGLGIAMIVDNMVEGELARGELERVLPERVGRRERLALVYPDRSFLDPKVRAFVDFLAPRIEAVFLARGSAGEGP